MGEEDSSEGRAGKISDTELLEAIHQTDSPVLKTSEITELEGIPLGERQVRDRLVSLQESGRVGSRMVSANGPMRLWWPKQVEMRQSWPSQNNQDSEIGVEVIDALDLPGRGDVLKQRREAVNAVFKYFFQVVEEEERVAASELRVVGWGADPDTYGSPESLWNNCLKKALDQSPLVILYQSEKNWGLSGVGLELKRLSETALWENWEDNLISLKEKYHTVFWENIPVSDTGIHIETPNRSSYGLVYESSGVKNKLVLEIENFVQADPSGKLQFIIVIENKSIDVEYLHQNQDELRSFLDFDVDIHHGQKQSSPVYLIRTYPFDFNPHIIFNQQNERIVEKEFSQINEWLEETNNQFTSLLEQLDIL